MEEVIKEALAFIKQCDADFENNLFLPENSEKAVRYLDSLKQLQRENNSRILEATIQKLDFIKKQIDAVNYHTCSAENVLNLVSLSVTDYIITLVKNKHLVDPLLIARYAYIELSKVLYYDISYVKQQDVAIKNKICDASVNVQKEKIFSYVVCTQWLQLYTYILKQFDIDVIPRSIPGQNHVWGEIPLNDQFIIVVDATDYINSSIDLSNAKSTSPTVGFVVLPKKYSTIKLYDTFYDKKNRELAREIEEYYSLNRDLDMALHYITAKGYPVERILKENELFHHSDEIITNPRDISYFLNGAKDFFKQLKIPNNIDGYEIYAYYNRFLKNLPRNIRANVSEETIYVDSFSYKIKKVRKQFLHVPNEYLQYLDALIYSRYYKYLTEEENNALFEKMKRGILNEEQLRDAIAKSELVIAGINREINLYYAINKLHFFEPMSAETIGIQLYEPMMGVKSFSNQEDYHEFQKTMLLK